MLPDSEPDTLEKGVRFVCGLIAGAILGLVILAGLDVTSSREAVVLIDTSAVIFAFCAMKFGDPFWRLILTLMSRF